MRRMFVYYCAPAIVALVAAGCSDSSSGRDGSAATSGTAGAAVEPNEAERLLAQMIAAYQQADSYADRGELRLASRVNGRLSEVGVPFSVMLQRPNKLHLQLYQGHVVCDGTQLWGWIDDLPGFILRRPLSGPLTLADIYADEALTDTLTRGLVGGSLQLQMLLGADSMELIRAGGERPELLADDRIAGMPCRRVRVRRDDGSFTYWIDAQTLMLRRIEFPMQAVRKMSLAWASDSTITADFVDPMYNPQIAPETFEFQPPPGVRIVDKLDSFAALPPPPSPAPTLGAMLGDFQGKRLDGRPLTRGDLAGKTAVVLFWTMNQSDSYGALVQLNEVYQRYRTRDDVLFLAANIDPTGPQGLADDALRAAIQNAKITVPVVRDEAFSLTQAFGVQYEPNLFIVSPSGVVEDNEIGLNPKLESELPTRIERVIKGESLAAEAQARSDERIRKYAEAQKAAGVDDRVNFPQGNMAPAREPQHLKMTRLWRNEEIAKPGYVLATDDAAGSRIIVCNGLDAVAELDGAGKLKHGIELELPKEPTEAVISFWRTAVDKQGKRVFVGSAGAQQQLHVFDADFQRLASFPDGTHAGISDVQLGDLDGDGEPEMCVGYWGVVGVQGVTLGGERIWSNRRLPENVLRLAVTPLTPLGKRRLLCDTGVMTVAVLDDKGEALFETPVGGRSLRLVAAADLKGDGGTALCGIATQGPGSDTAVGFDITGAELWNYPLPPGVQAVPEMQNEIIAHGKLLPNEPGVWIFAGADGTVHIVGADGKPIDAFAWGEPLHGFAVGTIDGAATLFISDAKSVTALQFSR